MLQPGLGETEIASAPQSKRAHPLRNRSFDSGASSVLLFELLGLLPSSRRLQCLVCLARPDRNRPPLVALRCRAQEPARTRPAVLARELDLHHLVVASVDRWRP